MLDALDDMLLTLVAIPLALVEMLDALVLAFPSTVDISPASDALIASLLTSADPLNTDTAELTSASVANVLSKDAVNISKALILPSCTLCSDAIELSRATL